MNELKIGETITSTIKCVEGRGCNKCCLYGICEQSLMNGFLCDRRERTDRKDVHFEIVEKPTEEDYTEQMRQLNEEWQENLKIQRQMMIDKACEWWNNELREVNYGTYNEAIAAFRKAMEE